MCKKTKHTWLPVAKISPLGCHAAANEKSRCLLQVAIRSPDERSRIAASVESPGVLNTYI